MLSHNHRCIFVHIPKTGGASIEQLLWPHPQDRTEANLWMGFVDDYHNKYQTGGLQHLLAEQIRAEVGNDVFTDYFRFTIVRNPWDKAVSQFAYMQQREDLRRFIGMNEDDDFKTYLSLIQKREHVQWLPQHRFVFDEKGNSLVDYVGRFEEYEVAVRSILDRLGVAGSEIPHANKSDRTHTSDYYDPESMEIVGEMYARDVEAFDYTRPSGLRT